MLFLSSVTFTKACEVIRKKTNYQNTLTSTVNLYDYVVRIVMMTRVTTSNRDDIYY